MQDQYTDPPPGRLLPEAARPFLTADFGHFCFRCNLQPCEDRPKMDVDHIIPVARGGGNTYGNYQFLCGPCNSWKGTKIIDFRPGEPRKIEADLPIIPNEERVRKSTIKPVPPPVPEIIVQTVVEKVQVPIMVPVPPMPHNCYDALPRLFGEYTRSAAEVARLSERVGKAEAECRSAKDAAHEERMKAIRHACGAPMGCFLPLLLVSLVSVGTGIYLWWRVW